MLADMAIRLEAGGADFLVMVCNTAHAFFDEASRAVSIPLISIIDETVRAIRGRHAGARVVGVMATPACMDSGLYQAALNDAGLAPLLPDDALRPELMNLIWRVKAGEQSAAVSAAMAAVANELVAQGADAIIAGCTEIPLVLKPGQLSVPLISSTDELARRTVELACGRVCLQAQS
jgi:aspartate racemase